MTETPLDRLCAHRGVAVPAAGHLLDLAAELDLRPADLLTIAGGAVPAEYLPADPGAAPLIESLPLLRLKVAAAEAARGHARSLAGPPTAGGSPGLPALEAVTFGAVFSRLMQIRNITRWGMAYATSSALSTVARTMRGGVPGPERVALMAATLCLRPDDVEAMAARGTEAPPPEAWVHDHLPQLWAVGELILALVPLQRDQINAVLARAPD
ncbi:hypothetical protein OHA72_09250 [Dactylosporangium sp. NBC_01737]|uniref:hypothetical protein n=1 Tax=Dactylosporangium sp. NBC_01737 TaxID=2975959 RepID=UPI002E131B15|nr:hypothetical protein OHA72_09250 [Dactylosporangium sp. NBC_01737]